MKVFRFTTYILLIVLISCSTTSETRVSKIENLNLNSSSGIVYALPKSNITFKVEAVRTDIFPGPYHEYAEKYMGLENVPHKKESVWQISNITIDTYNDIDADEIYLIEPSGKMNIDLKGLIDNQIIFPINKESKDKYENRFYGKNESGSDIVFKDLSVSKYVGEEQVTYYKRVQKDSLFAKVPVVKTQSVYKSFEDKAEEASSFIFMIREKRFELLSGMADYYPDGQALDVALKELDRLENEYIDLFIGKRFTSTYTASFEFSPEEKDLHQPYILFRFNKDKGVLAANDLSGKPIIIELEALGQVDNLPNFQPVTDELEHSSQNNLYYRVPDLVQVKVFDGSSLIASRKVKVEQFGKIILIPNVFLMNDEKFIEFYREEDE